MVVEAVRFEWSFCTTTAGRVLRISEPSVGSSATSQTSPRRGRATAVDEPAMSPHPPPPTPRLVVDHDPGSRGPLPPLPQPGPRPAEGELANRLVDEPAAIPLLRHAVEQFHRRPRKRDIETPVRSCRCLHEDHSHATRSEEHTSELQSLTNLVCRLLLEKKK